MNTIIVCSVSVWLLVLFVASSTAEPSDKEPKRSKLISYALTPSMRVGRRSKNTWDTNIEDSKQLPHHERIIPIIRISRSQSRNWLADEDNFQKMQLPKRTGANNGMWFGPRLGRVQKRAIDDDYQPWTYIIVNGERPVSRDVHYTPRLGRESEEYLDDGEDNVLSA